MVAFTPRARESMVQTFADQFAARDGQPIRHEGRELHAVYWLPVKKGDSVSLRFIRYVDRPIQGLGIRTEKCDVRVGDVVGKHIGLWTDTAPREVLLDVVKARDGARVGVFNQWRDAKYGTTMYSLNNAAMEVLEQQDGSLLLRCSHGCGDVDFSDLVVDLRLRAA